MFSASRLMMFSASRLTESITAQLLSRGVPEEEAVIASAIILLEGVVTWCRDLLADHSTHRRDDVEIALFAATMFRDELIKTHPIRHPEAKRAIYA